MLKIKGLVLNLVFFLQVLLVFLWWFEDSVSLPAWLQVAGRLHLALVHVPIGMLAFIAVLIVTRHEFKKKSFNRILFAVLLFTSLAASITAFFGFLMSRQSDYGADALALHKWGGIVLSFLCYGLVILYDRRGKPSKSFYGLAFIAFVTMFFAGHTGGTLTHGENFLLAPLNSNSSRVTDGSIFQEAVFPVLEKKCISCHNEAKAKGKLVMTSIEKFRKGGKHGVEWVEGKLEESRMIKFIHLPLSDEDHMPPDGKPQLSYKEMTLLGYWIKSGADFEKKLAALDDKDSLKMLAMELHAQKSVVTEVKKYEFSTASEETIAKLNTPFCSVFPLYQNSPALQADFFIRESFKSASLQALTSVAGQLLVLNLSKMPVTDQDLAIVATFRNLEKLNLNFSEVKGPGLSTLQSLKKLASLSLAGTAVSVESLESVLTLPELKELFVWNTKITEEDRKQLEKKYPGVAIATSQFRDDHILRLSKPSLLSDGILKKDEPLVLKNTMPGVTIRYTIDGTAPDSITSKVYKEPIKITSPLRIRAIACKQGWYCSDVFESICFIDGLKPLQVELLSAPDKQYPGEGAKSLTDGRKGFLDVFKEPSWLGYRDNPVEAGFDFGKTPPMIHSIVISYARSIGSYIFPPTHIEVWAGSSKDNLKLIQTLNPVQPTANEPQRIDALTIPIKGDGYPYYKLIAVPIAKLPAWHSGKGKKGWVMVDEVFFY